MNQFTRRDFMKYVGAGAAALALPQFIRGAAAPAAKPNIVYILADDLGYGDIRRLNPEGKIATPNLDRLAGAGIAFTDAHSSSAVCSPTRYGILTGRYNWRSRLKKGVLEGFSPRLIEEGRLTVPAMLKQQGYTTGAIGKWHLGMDWPTKDGEPARVYADAPRIDYSKPITNGPNAIGFDSFFGISASLDMPPFVFIENDRVTKAPTTTKRWVRSGPAAADFEAIDVLPTLARRAVDYFGKHAAASREGKPFFLYLTLTAPHTPILPSPEWQGKSGISPYADFVMQVDATVGQILEGLDKNGLTDSTLLFFASDNGCSTAANYPELLAKGHNPSYHFRGQKADIYDGGHRIPFMARWPGHIKPGTTSNQLVCLTDLMATLAAMLGQKLPDTAAEDSVSLVPALMGTDKAPLREAVVHHSIDGSFSIRQGRWKLELCPGSGGWSAPKPGVDDTSKMPLIQLYDLEGDISEKANVQDKHPEIVEKLTKLLEKYAADGRSTPGKPQPNTGAVDIWKAGQAAHQPLVPGAAAAKAKARKARAKKKAATPDTTPIEGVAE